MALISADNKKALQLYRQISETMLPATSRDNALIVVQHVVPNTIPFIQCLSERFSQLVIIPKPKSIDAQSLEEVNRLTNARVAHLSRLQTSDPDHFQGKVQKHLAGKPFAILDIGGYFSDSFVEIARLARGRLLSVIEDTENGHQKYSDTLQALGNQGAEFPVFSVARSPLKEPEDYLVGQSIAYSLERILRDNNALLTNKRVLVIGYGKIGKSIANSLSAKNVTVWIYDADPIRRAQALSHGYYAPERTYAIERVEVIVSATGNHSLTYRAGDADCDFMKLKDNCFIASVTSADDEFSIGSLYKDCQNWNGGSNLKTVQLPNDRSIHLLNDGNAVNFAHLNTLGPYIYMVGCELIACLARSLDGAWRGGDVTGGAAILELTVQERREVAEIWMDFFLDGAQQK